MFDYARRHQLDFPVCAAVRAKFGGKEEFNFGDLTDDHLADEDLVEHLRGIATIRVMMHFVHAGADVYIDRPLSLEWDTMFVLWSTNDFEHKYRMYKILRKWDRVKKFMDDALNECLPQGCERRTSLEWWWSWENSFVSAVLARRSAEPGTDRASPLGSLFRMMCVYILVASACTSISILNKRSFTSLRSP